ncbi:DUF6126 family protein [Streptomyces sp. cmx-4-9]|uniref:DUF6126 family protein n=1 Tax=Streptomyces sp. cmx-4-9 TaxID=2790941 RepID=UPI0039800F9F
MSQKENDMSSVPEPSVSEPSVSEPSVSEPSVSTSSEGSGAAGPGPATTRARIESKFPRGLVIRLIAYLFVGHLFAFFVYLLFVLGAENQ